MARLLLSSSDDWKLTFPAEHDVCGFEALGEDGRATGRRVADLVLDTDAERVAALLLDDGTEYPADDVAIGDHVVYLTRTAPSTAGSRRYAGAGAGALGGRAAAPAGADFGEHYARTYAATGRPYADYEPAYRYGSEMAVDPRYAGRRYDDAEADLRRDYEGRHGGSLWDDVKDAVRTGWHRVKDAAT